MHYFRAVDGSRRFVLAAVLAVGFSATALSGAVAGVKPADRKPFIGEWAIVFPEGAGVIVNKPDATCNKPAIISVGPKDMISICTPKGDARNWAVKAFGGRNPLWRDDGVDQTLVADWIDGDHFLLAGKDVSGIKTDWTRAKQWTPCK